jgi:hypothetical protein
MELSQNSVQLPQPSTLSKTMNQQLCLVTQYLNTQYPSSSNTVTVRREIIILPPTRVKRTADCKPQEWTPKEITDYIEFLKLEEF